MRIAGDQACAEQLAYERIASCGGVVVGSGAVDDLIDMQLVRFGAAAWRPTYPDAGDAE